LCGYLIDSQVGLVECPSHGSRFSFQDGSVVQGPATAPQPVFEARVRNGQIEVRRRG
jgi:nitrite reductase/ring-hydroxylating ferredoxin subunit